MTELKQNHHFIPRFWLRGFRSGTGQLFGRRDGIARPVAVGNVMQSDWLYTVYDNDWIASDEIENQLSVLEKKHAAVLRRFVVPAAQVSDADRKELCAALALQACRHPDVMRRGFRLSKELGVTFMTAPWLSKEDFAQKLVTYGVGASEAENIHGQLVSAPIEQLAGAVLALLDLPPWDPELPEQEALKAHPIIQTQLEALSMLVLDAPLGSTFVIGDTPIPQDRLGAGFSVPLSKSVAVRLFPASTPKITRCAASASEVDAINREQWDRALHTIVGSSLAQLQAF
ncbi:DUF4238 domain-containing protein [Variovorax atrisoli]|uniref:DUF4238 domain-containing protein n=1 Tax=Variovorax atrisoli TaxID=3394203 RepID=UPI00161A4CC0|nr:DUF4238 domain-containing protein [Variovorax sp. BK613]MBB3639822.1 hypothetical protein [Variovorax sp. BK613]